jgi:hypothetical protein
MTDALPNGRPILPRYTAPRGARHVLVAVDGAQHRAGVAMFDRVAGEPARLIVAVPCRNTIGGEPADMARLIARTVDVFAPAVPVVLVVERPMIYANKTAKTHGVEAIRAVYAALPWKPKAGWTPSVWKGNVPKGVCGARLERRAVEVGFDLERVDWTDDNAVDAFGIGMFALGLVARGCV